MISPRERVVKVAVVGSGLAGLTAAYLLSNVTSTSGVQFEVHLFEKASEIGMDSQSVSILSNDDREWRVNVPMRSFQGGYYPQLISLYKHLGVQFVKADFTYSFSSLAPTSGDITTEILYNGSSGRRGVSMPSSLLTSARRNKGSPSIVRLATWFFTMFTFAVLSARLLLNYTRLIILSTPFMRPRGLEHMSFRDWCKQSKPTWGLFRRIGLDDSWEKFCSHVLVPLFSAVCTAPEVSVLDHPVEEFLDYIWLTLFTHHYLVAGGIRDVVSRMTANVQHIHLDSTISHIGTNPDTPGLVSIECSNSIVTGFSHIILATQANAAASILQQYSDSLLPTHPANRIQAQLKCLDSFSYVTNIVINHTDSSLLPSHLRDKRELNLITIPGEQRKRRKSKDHKPDLCVGSSYTMATQILPRPALNSFPRTVYQTTNPIMPPKEDTVLSIAHLERAVLSMKAKEALGSLWKAGRRRVWECAAQAESGLGPLQGATAYAGGPRIWLCGSYAYCGIPLLEGCVVSARNVVEKGIFAHEGVAPLGLW